MSPALFSETQYTDWRIVALLLAVLAAFVIWRRGPRWAAVVAMIALVAGFLECRLDTVVDPVAVHVRFGWIPVYSRVIAREQIASIAPAGASDATLARQRWGWGAHWDPDGTFAMTIRGEQGVVLTLRDGSRLKIGSQAPGALLHALATGEPCARYRDSAC